jgi:hypothetical protein
MKMKPLTTSSINGGGKEWIDKHAAEAREIKVEGVEEK